MRKDVLSKASRSVLRVGDGRGFVIEKNGERLVTTGAHCLTVPIAVYGDTASKGATLPPAHGGAGPEERTYRRLLGRLGAEPHVSAEAVFCDPVSDLAVLGSVDGQEHHDEARAYDELVEALDPLPLGSLTFTYQHHTLPLVMRSLIRRQPPRATRGCSLWTGTGSAVAWQAGRGHSG